MSASREAFNIWQQKRRNLLSRSWWKRAWKSGYLAKDSVFAYLWLPMCKLFGHKRPQVVSMKGEPRERNMMDTVSNEELLEILEDVAAGYDCTRVLCDTPEIAAIMAREILALRAQQRWIPCSKSVPTIGEEVLVWVNCGNGAQWAEVAYLAKRGWISDPRDGPVTEPVTHWIPLPDPPDEEGEVS